MKIGYQGIEGSNSENASIIFIERQAFENVELVPLVDSKNVVNALINNEIDLGVMAISNVTCGIVEETRKALKDITYNIIDEIDLPIHHCLFKRKDVELKDIDTVSSHIQALSQTKGNLKRIFPNAKLLEVEDTAIAATYLKEGKLSETTAVVCSMKAGLSNNLELVEENIEDNKENYTHFSLFRK